MRFFWVEERGGGRFCVYNTLGGETSFIRVTLSQVVGLFKPRERL